MASSTAIDAADATVPRLARPASTGRIGGVQVVAVELVAMGISAAYTVAPRLAVAAGLLSVPLLLTVVGRYRGRWWYEVAMAWLALRRRRRVGLEAAARARRTARRAVPGYGTWGYDTSGYDTSGYDTSGYGTWGYDTSGYDGWGEGAAELAALAPHLTIRAATDRDPPVGVGADELGWFAAIALTPHDGLTVGGIGEVHLGWLTRQAAQLSAVQLVLRSEPRAGGDPGSPCALSYQDLRDAFAIPAPYDAWISIRLGLHDAAAAADRDIEEAAVDRILARALSRISNTLASHGVHHRVLDATALQEALLAAYGPGPYNHPAAVRPPMVGGGRTARESWTQWRSAETAHVCYAVTGWPAHASPGLLTGLSRVPGAEAVCVALGAGPIRTHSDERGPVGARLVVRLACAPDAVGHCQRQLRAGARRLGVGLVRLDGEQAPAVYSTMPTAAVYAWGGRW